MSPEPDTKDIRKRFDLRYEDAIDWINYTIKSGSRKGPISLIFWSLPLIFIEGKVIAAFFKKGEALPIRDTVRTIMPKQKNMKEIKIFLYENFLKALNKENSGYDKKNEFDLIREKTEKSCFDALDYFGFPCIKDKNSKKKYTCRHFTATAFNGKIEIWVAAEKKMASFFNNEFHSDELKKLAKRVEDISYEEYKIIHGKNSSKSKFYDYIFKKEKLIEQPQYTNGGGKLGVNENDYYDLIFSALHHALLEDMGWNKQPNNICIILSDNIYGCSMRFWLSNVQKNNYRENFKKFYKGKSTEDKNKFLELAKIHFDEKANKTIEDQVITIDNVIDLILKNLTTAHNEVALKIMYEQSGTVSSMIKLRGFFDTFLYPETRFTDYPIIYKDEFIKGLMKDNYYFSDTLKSLEKLLLVDWPNRNNNMSLAMIPFFLRGVSVGCVAFFIPSEEVLAEHHTEEQYWYQRLARALRRIESVEKHLEEAAVKQVCRTILDKLEGEAK